jgi:aspartate racemase
MALKRIFGSWNLHAVFNFIPMNSGRIMLGIFGGMGPEATAHLYRQIISLTPAEKDQDHIPTLIYSLPQVPERTRSIREGDSVIIPWVIEGVTRLEKAGASFIAIPCNTVHYYYDEMQAAVSIPIIHMIRETVRETVKRHAQATEIGLLATSGTIESGLYHKEITASGLRVVIPDDTVQDELVMKAVSAVKSGKDKQFSEDLLAQAARHLSVKGAGVIILGCTEIPLAFNVKKCRVPVVDATRVLSEVAVRMYLDLTRT